MKIKIWNRIPLTNNLRHPVQTTEYAHQRALDFEYHIRAQIGDEPRITAELDGIAETLLCVQQDCRAAQ